jgi:hypothetical protein
VEGQPRLRRAPVIEAGSTMSSSLAAVTAWPRDAAAGLAAVVLVEGASDQAAIEALAARRGRDLRAEGVRIVPMGGATNIGRFLDLLWPAGRDVRLAGLCDAGEAAAFGRGLRRAGLAWPGAADGAAVPGAPDQAGRDQARRDQAGLDQAGRDQAGRDRAALARLGFFVCVQDLEDELIRALGPDDVERVIAAGGDLRAWRTFQNQPAQRGRAAQQQLRRFMGTRSGGKSYYARVLARALEPDRVPEPLDSLLAWL